MDITSRTMVHKKKNRTVAVYARVSTELESQKASFCNQVSFYQDVLNQHPEWTLYKIYEDEGISGTSTKKRTSFLQMIKDAEEGCFDLIVTREVSRFARNTVDALQYTRILKQLGVEVYFITDNIWTLSDGNDELRLTIMATLAQGESQKKSDCVKIGHEMAFRKGKIFGSGDILGYKKVDGKLEIIPEEAETVRLIYQLYISGMGTARICDYLEKEGRLTALGNTKWYPSGINYILKNPLYHGELLYRKTITIDYITHRACRNKEGKGQFRIKGEHEPIISLEDFNKVQEVREKRVVTKGVNRYGIKKEKDAWQVIMRCSCGGEIGKCASSNSFIYYCKNKNWRRKKTNISCNLPVVYEWRLILAIRHAVRYVFEENTKVDSKMVVLNRQRYLDFVESKLQDVMSQYNYFLDLALDIEIDREVFAEKHAFLSQKITALREEKKMVLQEVKNMKNIQEIPDRDLDLDFLLDDNNEYKKLLSLVRHVTVLPNYTFEFCFWNVFKVISVSVSGEKRNPEISVFDNSHTE